MDIQGSVSHTLCIKQPAAVMTELQLYGDGSCQPVTPLEKQMNNGGTGATAKDAYLPSTECPKPERIRLQRPADSQFTISVALAWPVGEGTNV